MVVDQEDPLGDRQEEGHQDEVHQGEDHLSETCHHQEEDPHHDEAQWVQKGMGHTVVDTIAMKDLPQTGGCHHQNAVGTHPQGTTIVVVMTVKGKDPQAMVVREVMVTDLPQKEATRQLVVEVVIVVMAHLQPVTDMRVLVGAMEAKGAPILIDMVVVVKDIPLQKEEDMTEEAMVVVLREATLDQIVDTVVAAVVVVVVVHTVNALVMVPHLREALPGLDDLVLVPPEEATPQEVSCLMQYCS